MLSEDVNDPQAEDAQVSFERWRAASEEVVSAFGTQMDSKDFQQYLELDSPAGRDAAVLGHRSDVEMIAGQLALFTETAGDFHFALVRLLTEPVMAIAPFACARGVLEAAARGLWLADGSLDAHERLGRSMGLRLETLLEELTIVRSSPQRSLVGFSVPKRIRELTSQAKVRGVTVNRAKNGLVRTIGADVPSANDLVRKYLDAEPAFRVLSAVTHGQSAVVIRTSFRQVVGEEAVAEKNITAATAAKLLQSSALWFSRLGWAHLKYRGWATPELVTRLDALFDELMLPNTPKARAWLVDPAP
jgi:hypothetical protein